MTSLSDHFRTGRSGTIRTQTSASLKERKCEGPCSTARQQGRPPQPPSLTSSDPQVRWLASGLGPGQTADEVLRFLGPPSPNLASQHNQPGPPVATRELRVGLFFAPAGCRQRCGVLVGTSGAWRTISPQDGDECCVNRQLCTQEQWQPVSNNFQSPIVEGVRSSQVHVLNPHVQRHPCAGFPADAGSRQHK